MMFEKIKKIVAPLLLVSAGLAGGHYLSSTTPAAVPASDTKAEAAPPQAASDNKCDEKLPLLTSLYVTPMDPPKSKYAVNAGQFYLADASEAIKTKLDKRKYINQLLQVRDGDCKTLTIITAGEFSTPTDAWEFSNKLRVELSINGIPIKLPDAKPKT